MNNQKVKLQVVSTGQSQKCKFIFNDRNKTAYDPQARLMWFREANNWNRPMSWHDAVDKINKLNLENDEGLTGWRLPTIEELKAISIYGITSNSENIKKYALSNYFNDLGFDNVMTDWYWSSTPYIGVPNANTDNFKWAISMAEKDTDPFEVIKKCYVWPVRDADEQVR